MLYKVLSYFRGMKDYCCEYKFWVMHTSLTAALCCLLLLSKGQSRCTAAREQCLTATGVGCSSAVMEVYPQSCRGRGLAVPLGESVVSPPSLGR